MCHVQPPPPSILRFSQGFTVMPRNKTRPPLIRITPENPRNCTVARYYRARKNGIRVRFRHRGTASPFHRFHPIHPPRIFDPSIPPSAFPQYRYSRSVNHRNLRDFEIVSLSYPRDARSDLFPSSLERCISRSLEEGSNC